MNINHSLISTDTNSSQFYVFNLFADYVLPYYGDQAYAADLIRLLGVLGLHEQAARTTLARMRKRGWFEAERDGRRSLYRLTSAGRAIIAEGDKRIFEPTPTAWDGAWDIVVYSLPEELRRLRNELRTKLAWFGFGRLAPGTWITPHTRQTEIQQIIDSLDIHPYTSVFRGQHIGRLPPEMLVQKCWDLSALATQYEKFVQRWEPEYLAFAKAGSYVISVEQRFVRRFLLTYDYQAFPRVDPNLPVELLPDNWIGRRARKAFTEFRHILNEGLEAYIQAALVDN